MEVCFLNWFELNISSILGKISPPVLVLTLLPPFFLSFSLTRTRSLTHIRAHSSLCSQENSTGIKFSKAALEFQPKYHPLSMLEYRNPGLTHFWGAGYLMPSALFYFTDLQAEVFRFSRSSRHSLAYGVLMSPKRYLCSLASTDPLTEVWEEFIPHLAQFLTCYSPTLSWEGLSSPLQERKSRRKQQYLDGGL